MPSTIIVRGVRSGLTVGECLNIIGQESPDPVGPEFRLVNEAIKLGQPMADALQRMSDRLPQPGVPLFHHRARHAADHRRQLGRDPGEAFRRAASAARRCRDKVQAMSSEAKASAGIIGSLPLFVMAALSFLATPITSPAVHHGPRPVHARDLRRGHGLRRAW